MRWTPRLRNWCIGLVALCVLADLTFSLVQYLNGTLDGDMPGIIVPGLWHGDVLKDPFGFGVLAEGKRYTGTNRFFAHWFESNYYKSVPLMLQGIFTPIDSVYAATSLLKITIHIGLTLLLALYAVGRRRPNALEFLFAALLVTAFFQVNGFYGSMTLIDRSPTYNFFYALPLAWLLLFFLPFYRYALVDSKLKLSLWQCLGLVLLAIALPFHSPLIPAVSVLLCGLGIASLWLGRFKRQSSGSFMHRVRNVVASAPVPLYFFFGLITLVSLYSHYIGLFNTENDNSKSTADRYALLDDGLHHQLLEESAWPFVLAAVILNLWLMRRSANAGKVYGFIAFIMMFVLAYVALLPLGGYRPYRPLLISGDTFMPVTIAFIIMYGVSTMNVMRSLSLRSSAVYTLVPVALAVFLIIPDRFNNEAHRCEKQALQTIASSPQDTVRFEARCGVLEWRGIRTPEESKTASQLLYIWNVTDQPVLFTTEK